MPRTTTRKERKKAAAKSAAKVKKQDEPAVADVAKVADESQKPSYKSFRMSKRLKRPIKKLPSSFSLTKRAFVHVWRHKKLFAAIAVTYLVFNLLFVRGFVFTADLGEAKAAIAEIFNGTAGQVAGSFTVMSLLASSLNPASEVAALYQTMLVILFSLFVIWALRQTYAGENPRLRDVFYKSSYPLVQFVIIVFIIGVQLFPLTLASFLYSSTISAGVVSTFAEVFTISVLVFLLIVWSLYMITVSVFALYIVTLPDMTPLRALRSAKGLVNYRRWTVMRRVLFLPIAVMVIGFAFMIPIILFTSKAAEVIFLIASAFVLPLVHSYIYSLYRELLREK